MWFRGTPCSEYSWEISEGGLGLEKHILLAFMTCIWGNVTHLHVSSVCKCRLQCTFDQTLIIGPSSFLDFDLVLSSCQPTTLLLCCFPSLCVEMATAWRCLSQHSKMHKMHQSLDLGLLTLFFSIFFGGGCFFLKHWVFFTEACHFNVGH